MAETSKTSAPSTPTPTVEGKLERLKALRDSFSGKPNYNSHLWYKEKVAALEAAFLKGDKAAGEAILKLAEEVPQLVKAE